MLKKRLINCENNTTLNHPFATWLGAKQHEALHDRLRFNAENSRIAEMVSEIMFPPDYFNSPTYSDVYTNIYSILYDMNYTYKQGIRHVLDVTAGRRDVHVACKMLGIDVESYRRKSQFTLSNSYSTVI